MELNQVGNFNWWEGVVEDNLDPLGAGRCKVRVIGHNSPMKDELSTAELPWAYPLMPLNNPHGKIVALKPGTRVFGFYRDGSIGQDLVMMGTVNIGYENPGKYDNYDEESEPPNNINIAQPTPRLGDTGFADDREGTGGPIETQPKKSKVTLDDFGKLKHEDISDYGPLQPNEINTPRLQRGIPQGTSTAAHALARDVVITPAPVEMITDTHPYIGYKQDSVDSEGNLQTAVDFISEPENPFKAQYPFNTVEESDSGHLREIDDTPGAERIKETHRTGTFYEIHPDGSKVTKIIKDNFEVTIGDDFTKIKGRCAVQVDGQADFYCLQDINVKTEKNAVVTATESATVDAGTDIHAVARNGSATVSAGTSATVRAGTNATVSADESVDVVAGGDMTVAAGGLITFKDSSATAANVDAIIKDIDEEDGLPK